jgi:hypothetical protein
LDTQGGALDTQGGALDTQGGATGLCCFGRTGRMRERAG